ncbi:unnamed protein product, partial [Amoebophrya sp. A25]
QGYLDIVAGGTSAGSGGEYDSCTSIVQQYHRRHRKDDDYTQNLHRSWSLPLEQEDVRGERSGEVAEDDVADQGQPKSASRSPRVVYELKCVSKLEVIHRVQLGCYAYLYELNLRNAEITAAKEILFRDIFPEELGEKDSDKEAKNDADDSSVPDSPDVGNPEHRYKKSVVKNEPNDNKGTARRDGGGEGRRPAVEVIEVFPSPEPSPECRVNVKKEAESSPNPKRRRQEEASWCKSFDMSSQQRESGRPSSKIMVKREEKDTFVKQEEQSPSEDGGEAGFDLLSDPELDFADGGNKRPQGRTASQGSILPRHQGSGVSQSATAQQCPAYSSNCSSIRLAEILHCVVDNLFPQKRFSSKGLPPIALLAADLENDRSLRDKC